VTDEKNSTDHARRGKHGKRTAEKDIKKGKISATDAKQDASKDSSKDAK
jgi:hypothetical protein